MYKNQYNNISSKGSTPEVYKDETHNIYSQSFNHFPFSRFTSTACTYSMCM